MHALGVVWFILGRWVRLRAPLGSLRTSRVVVSTHARPEGRIVYLVSLGFRVRALGSCASPGVV